MSTKPLPAPRPTSLYTGQELDTDAVSPDSLKAAFDVVIDSLVSRAEGHRVALDWNSIEIALVNKGDESVLGARAQVLA